VAARTSMLPRMEEFCRKNALVLWNSCVSWSSFMPGTDWYEMSQQRVRGKPCLRPSILYLNSEATDYPCSRSMVVDHLNAASQIDDVGVACIYLSRKEA
jgi:hypothetical protein